MHVTFLESHAKILHDTLQHLHGNRNFSWILVFNFVIVGWVWYTLLLRWYHKKNSHTHRLGDLGSQWILPNHEMKWSPKSCWMVAIDTLAMWAVAPFWWNYRLSRPGKFLSWSTTEVSSISTYRADMIVVAECCGFFLIDVWTV